LQCPLVSRHIKNMGSATEEQNFRISSGNSALQWHICNYNIYKYAIAKQNFRMKSGNSASPKHYPFSVGAILGAFFHWGHLGHQWPSGQAGPERIYVYISFAGAEGRVLTQLRLKAASSSFFFFFLFFFFSFSFTS
jgi:hypothetical protein